MRLCESDLEARRKLEKAPWSEIASTVDAIFNNRADPMEKKRKTINERIEARTKAKEAAEKVRLAEEAERRRATAQAALEAAERAERERKDAELDRMIAEAERDNAIWERDNSERLQREAKAKADALAAQAARLELEQKARAAKAAEENEQRRIEREAEDKKIAELKAETKKHEYIASQAKLAAASSRDQVKIADVNIATASADIRAAAKEEKLALGEAGREEKRAERLDDRIEEGGLGRHRSEHGALASLSTRWVSRIVDRDKLPKDLIWPFISGEELEIAVRKYMMAQSEDQRSMPGAIMEVVEEGIVR
jgi:hypothetical protein